MCSCALSAIGHDDRSEKRMWWKMKLMMMRLCRSKQIRTERRNEFNLVVTRLFLHREENASQKKRNRRLCSVQRLMSTKGKISEELHPTYDNTQARWFVVQTYIHVFRLTHTCFLKETTRNAMALITSVFSPQSTVASSGAAKRMEVSTGIHSSMTGCTNALIIPCKKKEEREDGRGGQNTNN